VLQVAACRCFGFACWPCVLIALVQIAALAARGSAQVFADGRDRLTLLDPHLVNRNLFEQLDVPAQDFRLGRGLHMLALAADVAVGTQASAFGEEKTRFHGYYLADTFGAVRLLDGLDVNLNLVFTNPSASDGYRVSSQFDAGLSVHAYFDAIELLGSRLRADVVAFDLDRVTVGSGLLLEQQRMEGYLVGLTYRDLRLTKTFGGRSLWHDDDIDVYALALWGGVIEALCSLWYVASNGEGASAVGEPYAIVPYLGLALDGSPVAGLRLAAEYQARVGGDGAPRHAALARVDYLFHQPLVELHAGYQFRYYERGFGPRTRLSAPTVTHNTPEREDEYVTNSFAYLGISPFFTQWSHTGMLELRAPSRTPLRAMADVEYWLRFARDPRVRPVQLPDGERAPGVLDQIFYRIGVEWRPWLPLPHRARLSVTNKLVASGSSIDEEQTLRFVERALVLVEGEAFL
jgi:hypothetical protein